MNHKCPVGGCFKQLPAHILLCRMHWARVPRALQRSVYAAWNNGHPQPGYFDIRDEAIKAASGGE
jgi:hypothetical protein